MKYDFKYDDVFEPLVKRFNSEVLSFIDELKKRLGFIEAGNEQSTFHNDPFGLIKKVELKRREQYYHVCSIVITPHLSGRITIEISNHEEEVLLRKENINISTLFFDERDRGITAFKKLWVNPRAIINRFEEVE